MTSRHADVMDAVAYWRQFVVAFYFDTAGDELVGTVRRLLEERTRDEYVPKIEVLTKDGRVYTVTAHQARLRAELVREAPAVGDAIKITYDGEADRAAPGMNKAKEFTVAVKRQGSQPGAGPEAVRGSAGSDNAPRAGSKST